MKIILLLAAILLVNNVFSQTLNMQKRIQWNLENKTKVQKLVNPPMFRFKLTQQRGDTIFDKSVARIELTKEYSGNNGKGADVYNMKPYNMPCLIPDSTFHSNMPVKEFTMIQQSIH